MDKVVRLRLATAADLPALAPLYALAARTLGPQVYTPQQVQAWEGFGRCTPDFSRYILDADTWVAEGAAAAAGPLGFCGIDRLGEVHSLYVHPDGGRRGLGRQLALHAMDHARSQGVRQLNVWATPFSRRLFERLGFGLVEVRREAFQGILFDRFRLHRP